MSRIADSELIINNRGAIYHLDLRPEELADTVFLVGDPGRVQKVSAHFDRIEFQREHREFISHTGYIGQKRFTVLSTGIGPDNIDIALNELDALINIDFSRREIKSSILSLKIIRLGTSGSLQPDIPVDSFVVSTHGLGLDNLLNYYVYSSGTEEKALLDAFINQTGLSTEICHPYLFQCSNRLLTLFPDNFFKGITVTCPGFYAPQGRILRLGLRNPELINQLTQFVYHKFRITNFEMETSAIYGLGQLMNHDCLSVNAIIANRVSQEFSKDSNAAIEKMIRSVLEIMITQ